MFPQAQQAIVPDACIYVTMADAGGDSDRMTEGLKIAVVEDEKVHADVLICYLKAWLKENKVDFRIREFPNAAAFCLNGSRTRLGMPCFSTYRCPA